MQGFKLMRPDYEAEQLSSIVRGMCTRPKTQENDGHSLAWQKAH